MIAGKAAPQRDFAKENMRAVKDIARARRAAGLRAVAERRAKPDPFKLKRFTVGVESKVGPLVSAGRRVALGSWIGKACRLAPRALAGCSPPVPHRAWPNVLRRTCRWQGPAAPGPAMRARPSVRPVRQDSTPPPPPPRSRRRRWQRLTLSRGSSCLPASRRCLAAPTRRRGPALPPRTSSGPTVVPPCQ